MKALPLLLALLAVAGFSYWQKHDFTTRLQPELQKTALRILEDSLVTDPRVELNHLDTTLYGTIASLVERDDIASEINALQGIRLTPEGNHLRSQGYLEIRRQGPLLELSGEINQADASSTTILPHATQNQLITSEHTISPHGLSSPELSTAIQTILRSPGNLTIRIESASEDHQLIRLSGSATPHKRRQWKDLLSQLPETTSELHDLQIYPSIYHFPDYLPHSALPAESLSMIRSTLTDSQIFFAHGSTEITDEESSKLNALARSIQSAGSTIRYVLGGHTDSSGNAEANTQLSKARAQAVLDRLIERGLSPDQFEIVSFGASAAGKSLEGPDTDRRVELLLK